MTAAGQRALRAGMATADQRLQLLRRSCQLTTAESLGVSKHRQALLTTKVYDRHVVGTIMRLRMGCSLLYKDTHHFVQTAAPTTARCRMCHGGDGDNDNCSTGSGTDSDSEHVPDVADDDHGTASNPNCDGDAGIAEDPEDVQHMLLVCPALSDARRRWRDTIHAAARSALLCDRLQNLSPTADDAVSIGLGLWPARWWRQSMRSSAVDNILKTAMRATCRLYWTAVQQLRQRGHAQRRTPRRGTAHRRPNTRSSSTPCRPATPCRMTLRSSSSTGALGTLAGTGRHCSGITEIQDN